MNILSEFDAYCRRLCITLGELERALDGGDIEFAKELVSELKGETEEDIDSGKPVYEHETKLTIVFDKEKLKAAGKTEEDYMDGIREYYSNHPVTEIKHNVFVMSGEHAACVLSLPIINITNDDRSFVGFLKRCILDMGDEINDVIEETYRWYEEYDNTNQ